MVRPVCLQLRKFRVLLGLLRLVPLPDLRRQQVVRAKSVVGYAFERLERGTDIRVIQALLGLDKLETTAR
jgi:hypothetical protein